MGIEAVDHLAAESAPRAGGELLLNDAARFFQIRRTLIGIVAVGAEEVELTVIEQLQRQSAGAERGKGRGVALEIEGLFKKLSVHIALLELLITLYMREHDMQAVVVLQRDQLVEDPVGPADERHFDHNQIGALDRKLRDRFAVGDARVVENLGAEKDLGLGIG